MARTEDKPLLRFSVTIDGMFAPLYSTEVDATSAKSAREMVKRMIGDRYGNSPVRASKITH